MRYATFNVAQPDATDESLLSGSLSSSRRNRGMPGCSIKRMGLPRSLHGKGIPNASLSKRPMPTSPSNGRVATASRVRHSCTLTAKRGGPEPSWDTRRSEWIRPARSLKFQICLASIIHFARGKRTAISIIRIAATGPYSGACFFDGLSKNWDEDVLGELLLLRGGIAHTTTALVMDAQITWKKSRLDTRHASIPD